MTKSPFLTAAVLASLMVAAPAQSRVAAEAQVTIFARPAMLNPSTQRLTLYGSIASAKADEVVTIQFKECGATWFRGVIAVRTRAGGGWSNELFPFTRPTTTASVRAVWNGHESAPVTVRVRASLFFRTLPGSSTRFEVAAWRHWRKRVQIQRFDPRLGTWSTVRTVVLNESPGAAKFTASFPRGTSLRAVLPLSEAKPCFVEGTSRIVRT